MIPNTQINKSITSIPFNRSYLYRLVLLCRLEWQLLLRQQTAWASALLFVVASVFALYISISGGAETVDGRLWNGLFWIILLFATLYVVGSGWNPEQLLFYYLLDSVTLLFAAKVLGQAVVLFVLGAIIWASMAMWLGQPVLHMGLFVWGMGGGVLGMVGVGVCVALMVARLGERQVLLVVLALPLLLPLFVFAWRSTYAACSDGNTAFGWGLWSLVACVTLFIFVMLPFIWKS